MLHHVGLIPLAELDKHFPTVAEKLDHGKWTRQAEQELLRVAGGTAEEGAGGNPKSEARNSKQARNPKSK
jgi:hypothetical protein